jgi:hypothetical protein
MVAPSPAIGTLQHLSSNGVQHLVDIAQLAIESITKFVPFTQSL